MPDFLLTRSHMFDTQAVEIVPYSSGWDAEEVIMGPLRNGYWEGQTQDLRAMIRDFLNFTESMLENDQLLEDARNLKADLIIIDNVPFMRMLAVLAYRLNTSFAYAGSAFTPSLARLPISAAAYPVPVSTFTDRMTFPQRLISYLLSIPSRFLYNFHHKDAVARYAPEMPYLDIHELELKAEVTLVEQDHILDYPQPTLPNVIRLGGTAICKAKELKEPYKSFVESSDQDIVVVSFGSYVLNIPEEISTKMMNAFLRLKLKIVWRVNVTSADPQQVMTSLWIPQNDLLGHAKVKVFVSHCGKNGQYESLYHAVPMLCLPLFTDQPYNAERARYRGFGLTADVKTISEDDLLALINELLDNATYSKNIQRASQIFKDIYGLPVERAAFWLDHVIKYGGSHMRYAGQDMPGYQFYDLDVLGVLILSAVFFISFCGWFLYCCLQVLVRRLTGNRENPKLE
ncbi:UDP-glucuronosyltransferase 1-6 [Aplysia californica]|uniref:UDP-glucuronosyltransferase n=1 Tax=Aplysia californica TaxID=6500 RepID=A0ABM0K730_APLCA|nr:UDP-glucuronosyltransferase 1-6 [Aplysia californica]